MVKFDIPDISKDLPMSMTMAAFWAVAWYIAVELNIRLFYLFRHRKGLYFWSCALCTWGLILHPLAIMLADFMVIKDPRVSVPLIYLSWWLMTIPFSLVMYSRLNLIMSSHKYILRGVLCMIIFTTLCVSIPSMVLGPWSQQPTPSGIRLASIYSIWLRIENATWFVQETIISLIYIIYTYKHLKDLPLFSSYSSSTIAGSKQVMHHLIATNIIIIVLDIALMSIVYAGLFYLGGSFKPAVYGVKLRIEFSILNRLVEMVRSKKSPLSQYGPNSTMTSTGTRNWVSQAFTGNGKEHRRRASESEGSESSEGRGILVVEGIVDGRGIRQMTEVIVESGRPSEASTRDI